MQQFRHLTKTRCIKAASLLEWSDKMVDRAKIAARWSHICPEVLVLTLKELSQHFPTQSKGQGHFGRDGAAMVVLLLAFDLRDESRFFTATNKFLRNI